MRELPPGFPPLPHLDGALPLYERLRHGEHDNLDKTHRGSEDQAGKSDSGLEKKKAARFTIQKRKRRTSCTSTSSLMASGEMFLRRSMVSYMPCTSRSLSTEPSICLSSTRPTRKTIFTPRIAANRQVTFQNPDRLSVFGRSLGGATFTEEHVPHSQHAGPRQRAREDAHEPLGHVENRVDLELLQVAVGHGTRASQQREKDLTVQLDRFLPGRNQSTRQGKRA